VRSKLVTCLLQPKGTDGESAGGVFELDLIYIRITVSPYYHVNYVLSATELHGTERKSGTGPLWWST
jgi:hypothetical protein